MDDFVIGNFSSYGDTFVSKPSYNVKIRYDLFNLIPNNHQINTLDKINVFNIGYFRKQYIASEIAISKKIEI